jgi:large repetitive protein
LAFWGGLAVASLTQSDRPTNTNNDAAQALQQIKEAAENNTAISGNLSPSVFDAAGINGVTASNVDAINSALDSSVINGAASDTPAEIQAIVDAYNAILTNADGNAGNAASPGAAQYAAVGVSGISAGSAQEALLGDIIDGLSAAQVDTVPELQALADAAAHVMAAANSADGNATGSEVSLADLGTLGMTGVTIDNLAAIRAAIAASADDGTGVDTAAELQAVVDNINALAVSNVNVADGTYGIGDSVSVTLTVAGGATGLTLSSAVFNGHNLTGINDNGDGTYTGTYTVISGDTDVTNGASVTTLLVFTDTVSGYTGAPLTRVTLSGESVDANAPTAATLTLNNITADNVLNSTEAAGSVNISGTTNAPDTTTITLTVNGQTFTGQASGGTFSIAVPGNDLLADGNFTVDASLTLTDAAGNSTTSSAQHSYTVNNSIISANFVAPADASNNTGISGNLVIGFNASVTGTGSGNIEIRQVSGDSLVATLDASSAQISGSGASTQASIAYSGLSAGTAYYIVIGANAFKDSTGNAYGGTSATGTSGWDFTTVEPALGINPIAGDNLVNMTENSQTITLSGDISSSAGAVILSQYSSGDLTITLSDGGSNTVTATNINYNSANGHWTADIAANNLLDGVSYTASANVAAAGSAPAISSTSFQVIVDTTAPTTPASAPASYVDDAGSIQSATSTAATTDDTTPGINVGSGLTDTVSLYVDGTKVAATYNSVTGAITPSAALGSGAHTLSYTLTDAAGNESGQSPTLSLTVDTSAPNAPTLSLGTGVANGATSAEATAASGAVTVSGENGAAISVTFTGTNGAVTKNLIGTSLTQAVVLNAGDLSALGNGAISVSATQTDAAGNAQTAPAATTNFTLDTAAAAPMLGLAADTGSSTNDGITNNSTVNLSGLESGASWQYQIDGGSWVNGTGSSFTLSSGTHSYSVHQTDAAGNTSNNSSAVSYTLDTTAPTLIITDDTSGTASGAVTYTFTFSEDVGSSFTQSDISASVGTISAFTKVDATHYTAMVTPPLGSGTMNVSAGANTFQDIAGNSNTASAADNGQLYNVTPAGQSVIDLGTYGQLIEGVQVEGHWYYMWDRNKDGQIHSATINGLSDAVTMDYLESTFFGSSTGIVITESNRSFTINGINLKLPTDGISGATLTSSHFVNGTTWSNATSGWNTTLNSNAIYDDLAAIWDAFNGTSTGTNIQGFPSPSPSGWRQTDHWVATPTATGHAIFSLAVGYVSTSFLDTNTSYVAFEVL